MLGCAVLGVLCTYVENEVRAPEGEGELASPLSLADGMWVLVSTFHGSSYGDAFPATTGGRLLCQCMLASLAGFHFVTHVVPMVTVLCAGGKRAPLRDLGSVVAQSMVVVSTLAVVCAFLAVFTNLFQTSDSGEPTNDEPGETNFGVAFFVFWGAVFRMSYGDDFPADAGARFVAYLLSFVSAVYVPVVVARVCNKLRPWRDGEAVAEVDGDGGATRGGGIALTGVSTGYGTGSGAATQASHARVPQDAPWRVCQRYTVSCDT